MKKNILDTIYKEFEKWSLQYTFCCSAGCSTCCTKRVTITALEGERILEFCISNNLRTWLLEKLDGLESTEKPQQTTNEYILASLENQDIQQTAATPTEVCQFLENNICRIYPARPFSCRCFASEKICKTEETAAVADQYLYGSIAAMQVIEHLGQFDSWGYMADVLLDLIESKKYQALAGSATSINSKATKKLLSAQPIPGFIIPEEQKDQINSLLQSIFTARVGLKTIEQILNGR